MHKHVELLRAWYRDYRARARAALRNTKQPPWTEAMVLQWLCLLGIPPFEHVLPVLERGERACACGALEDARSPFVSGVFPPDGCVLQCPNCGVQWLERKG